MKQVSRRAAAFLAALVLVASCQSSEILESAATTSNSDLDTAVATPQPAATDADDSLTASAEPVRTAATGTVTAAAQAETLSVMAAEPALEAEAAGQTAVSRTTTLAMLDPSPSALNEADRLNAIAPLETPAAERPKKTYLVNGLLSAVPFIGYGFRSLKEKMPEAELFSYMGIVEGPAVIAPKIVREAEAAWRANPDTMINLIGISLGADLVTVIANQLDEKGVPVNYLGIVDGTNLQPIPDNVRKADNLTCSYLDCTRARAKLAGGNTATRFDKKVYRSSHIPLGGNDELHARVIAQSNSL